MGLSGNPHKNNISCVHAHMRSGTLGYCSPRAALRPRAAGAATSGDAFGLASAMFEMATGLSLPQALRAQLAELDGDDSAEAAIQAQLKAAGLQEAARAHAAAGGAQYRFLAAQAAGLIGAHKARCPSLPPSDVAFFALIRLASCPGSSNALQACMLRKHASGRRRFAPHASSQRGASLFCVARPQTP
jgi:hypothetical protein